MTFSARSLNLSTSFARKRPFQFCGGQGAGRRWSCCAYLRNMCQRKDFHLTTMWARRGKPSFPARPDPDRLRRAEFDFRDQDSHREHPCTPPRAATHSRLAAPDGCAGHGDTVSRPCPARSSCRGAARTPGEHMSLRTSELWSTRLASAGPAVSFSAAENPFDAERLSRSPLTLQNRRDIARQTKLNPGSIIADRSL